MGLTTYAITPGVLTTDLTNVVLNAVNFSFTVATGNIATEGIVTNAVGNITLVANAGAIGVNGAVSAGGAGTVTITATGATSDLTIASTVSSLFGAIALNGGRHVILGASAIITGSNAYNAGTATSNAVSVIAGAGSVSDSSGANLTASTANIQTTAAGAGIWLAAASGSIGSSGTGRIDIGITGLNSELLLNAGVNDQVKLLQAASTGTLNILTVTDRPIVIALYVFLPGHQFAQKMGGKILRR